MEKGVASFIGVVQRRKSHAAARSQHVAAVALLLLFAALAASPISQDPSAPRNPHLRDPFESPDGPDPVLAARQAKALNMARQKSLVADTDRLLKLAQELNAEIAAGDQGSLTPIQSRKLSEIEKLAHNVKDKMSDAVSGAPAAGDMFSPTNP